MKLLQVMPDTLKTVHMLHVSSVMPKLAPELSHPWRSAAASVARGAALCCPMRHARSSMHIISDALNMKYKIRLEYVMPRLSQKRPHPWRRAAESRVARGAAKLRCPTALRRNDANAKRPASRCFWMQMQRCEADAEAPTRRRRRNGAAAGQSIHRYIQ